MSTTEMLSCTLTREEAEARARELADKVREVEEAETAAKAAAAAARDELKELEGDVHRLARIVREGREDRLVEVDVRRNLAEATIERVRLDTGELVSSRPMTFEEKQIPLHLVESDAETAEEVGP